MFSKKYTQKYFSSSYHPSSTSHTVLFCKIAHCRNNQRCRFEQEGKSTTHEKKFRAVDIETTNTAATDAYCLPTNTHKQQNNVSKQYAENSHAIKKFHCNMRKKPIQN